MKGFREKCLGSFIVVILGLTASGQTPFRGADEKEQARGRASADVKAAEAFRVYRGEHFYVTDYRGADLLRTGINEGYRAGFSEGEKDHQRRFYDGYRASKIFKDALTGYKHFVAADEYQYYFRRGFELGYYDGFDGFVRYGTSSSEGRRILDSVIAGILDIRAN